MALELARVTMYLRGLLTPRWTDSPDSWEAELEVALDDSVNAILDGAGVCTSSDFPTEEKRVPSSLGTDVPWG